jgi:hypothetical protein
LADLSLRRAYFADIGKLYCVFRIGFFPSKPFGTEEYR